MDIILPTRFNNPSLPRVERKGFRDDFDRPANDAMGETNDGKRWLPPTNSGSNIGTWGPTGEGTAGLRVSGSSTATVTADAMTADGVLEGELASLDASRPSRRVGLAVRVADANNGLFVMSASDTNHGLRIAQRVNGNQKLVGGTPARVLQEGDRLAITVQGTSISVSVNGGEVMTGAIDPALEGITTHGLCAFGSAVGFWDWVQFTE